MICVFYFRVVTSKVAKLKRAGQVNRGQVARAQENVRTKNKREENETVETALNAFRMKTAMGNYAKCVLCLCNKNITEVTEFQEKDLQELGLEEEYYKPLRRATKYFKCNSCSNSVQSFTHQDGMLIRMKVVHEDQELVWVPGRNSAFVAEGDAAAAVENSSSPENLTVFFPTSIEALKIEPNVPIKTMKDMNILIYRGDKSFEANDVACMYQNQLSKYQSVKLTGDLFFGKVKNNENKTLTSVKKQAADAQIQGSDRWQEVQEDNLATMSREFGKLHVKIEVMVPQKTNDVLATVLMQQGIVVSIDYEGDPAQEQTVKYLVHTGTHSNTFY